LGNGHDLILASGIRSTWQKTIRQRSQRCWPGWPTRALRRRAASGDGSISRSSGHIGRP